MSELANLDELTAHLTGYNSEARAAAYDASQAAKRASDRWDASFAPERQARAKVQADGEWGRTLARLNGKLGVGLFAVLTGRHGSGKTQLGVEMMRHQIHTLGKSALFLSATEFFIEVKATYRPESKNSEADVLAKYAKPALLVVDEIEKRGASEWENNVLFHLFNKRYNAIKDTLLISNLPERELCQHLGSALVSRLNEAGGVIACDWPRRRDAL